MATLTLPTQGGDDGTWGTELNAFIEGSYGAHLANVNVSFASNAQTTLYTVPAGKVTVITAIMIIAGANAGTTTIEVGVTAGWDNWAGTNGIGGAPINLGNVDAAKDVLILSPATFIATPAAATILTKYTAGEVIKMDVTNQAGGATNAVYVFGFTVDA